MIEKIAIKNVATFDPTGIEISDLKKVNFIYGANGSGKTTISNLVQTPKIFEDAGCFIKWKNDLQINSLVYNKKFREGNFGKGKIPGVFTLGKATTEEMDAIDEMKKLLKDVTEQEIQKKTTIENQNKEVSVLEDSFQNECWKGVYKKFEYVFNDAFIGFKKGILLKDKLLVEYKSNISELKPFEELKKQALTVFGQVPQQMNEIAFIDFTRFLEIENDPIWNKKIIGKSDVGIAQLILKLNINDWINQGREYIEEGSLICPFCQKSTIDESFRNQIEKYFDETFIADTRLVKELYDEYISFTATVTSLLQNIEMIETQDKNSKINIQLFSAHLKTLDQQFISNKEILNSKLKEPSRGVEISSIKDQLDSIMQLILEANCEVKKHNLIVDNYQKEKNKLVNCIWRYFLEEKKTTIHDYFKKINGLKKGIEKLEVERRDLLSKHKDLKTNIEESTKNTTGIQSSIDEINKTLSIYGFANFKIVPYDDNHYCIQRENGENAEHSLSEGEITFITFLYFLQLVKGGLSPEDASEDKVLVVDDPISSLDSTILFVVSSLLKEVIKNININKGNIKQIIILTHNVYFHKEVSFIDGGNNQNKDANFWIIRKTNNHSQIQPFGVKNPIRGSYELLWDELKHTDKLSDITVQNIMRRIIEAYFRTMGKYNNESILDSFKDPQEKEVCRSLMCWLNFGSHCIPDDLFAEQQASVKDLYIYVFKKTFENMGHIDHYNMMTGATIEE